MKFKAEIEIMPHPELLDPQGKTVVFNIKNIGIQGIDDIRIGKHIDMILEASDEQEANRLVQEACQKLLANPIMEHYKYKLSAN
jgi:phosphoribosylformylglycinamidine synthase subunit PurS